MEIRRDLHNLIALAAAVNVVAIADGEDPAAILVARNGAQAVECVVFSGAFTDGSAIPVLSHGDASDGSDLVAVDDIDLLGLEADAVLTGANQIKSFGYVGNKGYLSLQLVTAAGTTMTVGAMMIRSALPISPDAG